MPNQKKKTPVEFLELNASVQYTKLSEIWKPTESEKIRLGET